MTVQPVKELNRSVNFDTVPIRSPADPSAGATPERLNRLH
jgi:hypothetical protein